MRLITTLVPRKSDVHLGDRIFRIGEMRLSDLADLQAWLEERWECPLDSLRGSLAGLEEWARKKALRGIWDATKDGPAVWGTYRARKMFQTGEGVIEQFRVILREHHPELCQSIDVEGYLHYTKLEELAETVSNHPEGYDQFYGMIRQWQPMDAIDELAYLLDEVPEPQGKPITLVQSVMEVCEVYHWTIDYAMGLTMRQFKAARAGGKATEVDDFGTPVAPKTNLKAMVAAKKAQIAREEMGGIRHGR
jgi:hypothetical protein